MFVFSPFPVSWQIFVQIGHNVVIGKCCMICGQVGIAGSATYVYSFIGYMFLLLRIVIWFLWGIFSRFILLWACRLGNYVTLGGRVAIRDHVSIVSKVLCSQICVFRFAFFVHIASKLDWIQCNILFPCLMSYLGYTTPSTLESF